MHNLTRHLEPSSSTLALVGPSGRRINVLRNRMERPGSVGELVAAANALAAQGSRFYASVETTVEAREAGIQCAWICSDPRVVQAMEEPDTCFVPGPKAGEYITRDVDEDAFGDERDLFYWTFEQVGRAWIVIVEWFAGPRS